MSDFNDNSTIWVDLSSGKLVKLIEQRIEECHLDLGDLTILTDARTEEDGITLLTAARAGARRIIAVGPPRPTVRGAQVEAMVRRFAAEEGLESRIQFVNSVKEVDLDQVDIVALDRQSSLIKPAILQQLPSSTVLGLMFDSRNAVSGGLDITNRSSYELQISDINIADPRVGVLEFLSPLCQLQIQQAGLSLPGLQCLLLCDNEMAPALAGGLTRAGAQVTVRETLEQVESGVYDALILALTPSRDYRLDLNAISRLPDLIPHGMLLQFWGDIDRSAARYFSVEIWPPVHPGRGQMGIRLSALGSEPVVALRVSALKAAVAARRLSSLPPHRGGQLAAASG
ncbi:hypothetical protein FPY71_08695 [Aureimonas fodinaquatilis]|uniref:Uncharacterized protein n=1 Tax=Aureimonas fodinaquatilis TaxID=2565783 RepID=A0A5B0DW31_9HYPH|nr:hypothetical protein [Aureimonas fodinaquatilis]KAA0970568.1 hypothetical protein FPY71_08695 [Aureimonas fodinaquatilis]